LPRAASDPDIDIDVADPGNPVSRLVFRRGRFDLLVLACRCCRGGRWLVLVEEDAPMNPIEVLYCWQAILIAGLAAGATQLVKTLYDIRRGQRSVIDTPTVKDAAKVGRMLRKDTDVIFDRIILPACPIFFGASFAALIPARPDVIMAYITTHNVGASAVFIYMGWGAACGQVADHVVSKTMRILRKEAES
jgi:hypothetical protein